MSLFVKMVGIIGGCLFAYCGVPTAYMTIKAGKSIGTPVTIAWSIAVGALCMYSYLYLTYGFDLLLAINYSIEFGSWAAIVFYHYRGSK